MTHCLFHQEKKHSQENYKLVMAYDGTHYSGWQIQPNGDSIQEKIQLALKILLKREIQLKGSGRTDAGVHALGQVANFTTDAEIDPYRFLHSLNGLLPHDIRILSIESVPLHFHAQYSAVGKEYHYHLALDKVQNPFKRNYSLHVRTKIDKNLLLEASRLFLGTHDFLAFANSATQGTASYDSVRTIKRLEVVDQDGGVRIEIEADGFLYKMVRNIVGMLLEVASGKRAVTDISRVLSSRDRCLSASAAPPHGLFLIRVDY